MTTDSETMTSVQERHDRPSSVPWIRQVKAFTLRSFREQSRNRTGLFFSFVFPILIYLQTTRFSAPLFAQSSSTWSGAGKATMAVSLGLFGAFFVSVVVFVSPLSSDLEEKRYRKLRSLPIAPSADLVGRFSGGVVLAAVAFVFMLGIGLLDGATFTLRSLLSIPAVAVSLVLFCAIGMAIATIIAIIIPKPEYVTTITSMGLFVLFFLTGSNGIVPGSLPATLRNVLNYVPNALATRIQIYYLIDPPTQSQLTPPALPGDPLYLGLLAVYAVGFIAVAAAVMRRSIYRGDAGE
jgi:ABC-2 type transport system permease protein